MKGMGGGAGLGSESQAPGSIGNDNENPFMKACQQLFKDFDATKAGQGAPDAGP